MREVGRLTALQTLTALILGLLVGANLARAALHGAVPPAAPLGLLGMPLVYLVAGLGGAAGLVFVVACQAYLPGIVPRDRPVAGNGALRASEAAAQLVGPALGGLLVPLLGAATTVGAVGWAIADGLRHVRGDPTLRPRLLGTAAGAVCANVPTGIFLGYAARDLAIPAGASGWSAPRACARRPACSWWRFALLLLGWRAGRAHGGGQRGHVIGTGPGGHPAGPARVRQRDRAGRRSGRGGAQSPARARARRGRDAHRDGVARVLRADGPP